MSACDHSVGERWVNGELKGWIYYSYHLYSFWYDGITVWLYEVYWNWTFEGVCVGRNRGSLIICIFHEPASLISFMSLDFKEG